MAMLARNSPTDPDLRLQAITPDLTMQAPAAGTAGITDTAPISDGAAAGTVLRERCGTISVDLTGRLLGSDVKKLARPATTKASPALRSRLATALKIRKRKKTTPNPNRQRLPKNRTRAPAYDLPL